MTWAELDARAAAAAALVRDEGVGAGPAGGRAGRRAGRRLAAILGVLRAGAVACPVHGGLTTRELDAAVRAVDPALVLRVASLEGRAEAAARPGPRPDATRRAPRSWSRPRARRATPTGVVLSHRAMAASAASWLAALPPATGWVLALGLAHVAGLGIVWRALC